MKINNKSELFKLGLVGITISASLVLPFVAKAETYIVKQGDTLSVIANNYHTSIDKIAKENNISNIHLINIGQSLKINEATNEFQTENTVSSKPSSTASNLNTADTAAKELIAQHESGGSYTAQNGQYYGRYQLSLSYLNGNLSPENQEAAAENYVKSRYGSWSAALNFWNANGWY